MELLGSQRKSSIQENWGLRVLLHESQREFHIEFRTESFFLLTHKILFQLHRTPVMHASSFSVIMILLFGKWIYMCNQYAPLLHRILCLLLGKIITSKNLTLWMIHGHLHTTTFGGISFWWSSSTARDADNRARLNNTFAPKIQVTFCRRAVQLYCSNTPKSKSTPISLNYVYYVNYACLLYSLFALLVCLGPLSYVSSSINTPGIGVSKVQLQGFHSFTIDWMVKDESYSTVLSIPIWRASWSLYLLCLSAFGLFLWEVRIEGVTTFACFIGFCFNHHHQHLWSFQAMTQLWSNNNWIIGVSKVSNPGSIREKEQVFYLGFLAGLIISNIRRRDCTNDVLSCSS